MENDRVYQRKSSSITATFDIGDRSFSGAVTDLSRGGAFVDFDGDVSIGEKFDLQIRYLSLKEPFSVRAEVVSKRPDGIGVKFDDLSEEQHNLLSFLFW